MPERDASQLQSDASAASPKLTRVAVLVVSVAVAYYLGARVGFVLRFPPATTSLLWPPTRC